MTQDLRITIAFILIALVCSAFGGMLIGMGALTENYYPLIPTETRGYYVMGLGFLFIFGSIGLVYVGFKNLKEDLEWKEKGII